MTTFHIRFAQLCRRIHSNFAVAISQGDVPAVKRALINATRLWNLADHRDDGDQLWRLLDTYCGDWYFADRYHPKGAHINSARFTYVISGPCVSLLNVSGAITDYLDR